MSLTSAMRIAQNSIFNTSLQTSVVSKNIAEASNPEYVRRNADHTVAPNGARVIAVRRNENEELFHNNLEARASSIGQSVIANAADRLNNLVNGANNSTSPATLITRFEDALQLYSSDPSNSIVSQNTISAAKELAIGLNNASAAVQAYRSTIDQDIADGVAKINDLLSAFEIYNNEVVKGTASNTNINDALDNRESVLRDLSEYISISVVNAENNSQVLFTGQGVTLFETVPRTVAFEPTNAHSPGVSGNQIRIDGVPVNPGSGADTSAKGFLAANLQARDDLAMNLQGQLDEIARGLVNVFAETDQTASALPAQAGLFTWSGGPAVPDAVVNTSGISLSLSVNPLMDPFVGGSPDLLRDGGANGAAYVANTTGAAAYSTNLIHYVEQIDEPFVTNTSYGLTGSLNLSKYADASIGWLDSVRSTATRAADSKSAFSDRLNTMLSANTGVNMTEELTMLVDLEQSYQASARMISTVNEMFDTLLRAAN